MIHLQSLVCLATPCQSAGAPVTLRRLTLLNDAREWREAERAEFEDVGFVEKGSVSGGRGDGCAVLIVGFPFGDVG